MRTRRVALAGTCALALSALLGAPEPPAALGAFGGTPPPNTSTPVNTPTNTAVPTVVVTARATNTTAPVATSTFTFTVVPSPTPTTPPPATPTPTFTPAGPTPTTIVLGTPTNTPAPLVATSTQGAPTATAAAATATPAGATATAVSATATPAGNTSTPTPSPTPCPNCVLLNEVLTRPQDVNWDGSGNPAQAQWVELYNTTSSDISLVNWRIVTSAAWTDHVFPAGSSIAAHGYVVRFRKDLNLDLSSGAIELLDPNGAMVDSVTPPQMGTDQSYARLPDGSSSWIISTGPTLRSANVLPPVPTGTPDLQATVFAIQTQLAAPLPSPPTLELDDGTLEDADQTAATASRRPRATHTPQPFQSLAIADIRNLPDETPVMTTGVVTMPAGLWDVSRGYIQAGGAGIMIHTFGLTATHVGDTFTIKGRIHHYRGEVEIAAVKNGEQDAPGGSLPAARQLPPGGVGPGAEALLVQVSGHVQRTERDYVTIADDSGSARVFLYSRLNFGSDSLKPNAAISVTGVVNAAESGGVAFEPGTFAQRSLTASHRLVPRLVGDIVVEGIPQAAPEPSGRPGETARPSGERPGDARTSPGPAAGAGSGRSAAAGAAGSGSAPIATPILTGRQAAPGAPGARATPSSTFVLSGMTSGSPPVWFWLLAGLGLGLLVGGGAFAIFAPRLLARLTGESKPEPPR